MTDNRGGLIGARDDYARTDAQIRHIRDYAVRGLDAFDLLDPMDPRGRGGSWRWRPEWMNAAWLTRRPRPARLGPRRPPHRTTVWPRPWTRPTHYDLTHEEDIAADIILQGRPPLTPART